MGKFWLGFVIAVVVVLAAEFMYVRFGFVDPRADIAENGMEQEIAMPALDAAVDHRAPKGNNPVPASDENVMAGMKMYQTNCAGCHGDIQHPDGMFPESLYPRVPLFMKDAPDMPQNENFYIIEHGVRLSGMPAWGKILTEQQAWQVTAFLSKMDKLSPDLSARWKAMASASDEAGK